MSFILDALRKSEHARQKQTGPALAEVPVAAPKPLEAPRMRAQLPFRSLQDTVLSFSTKWMPRAQSLPDAPRAGQRLISERVSSLRPHAQGGVKIISSGGTESISRSTHGRAPSFSRGTGLAEPAASPDDAERSKPYASQGFEESSRPCPLVERRLGSRAAVRLRGQARQAPSETDYDGALGRGASRRRGAPSVTDSGSRRFPAVALLGYHGTQPTPSSPGVTLTWRASPSSSRPLAAR